MTNHQLIIEIQATEKQTLLNAVDNLTADEFLAAMELTKRFRRAPELKLSEPDTLCAIIDNLHFIPLSLPRT